MNPSPGSPQRAPIERDAYFQSHLAILRKNVFPLSTLWIPLLEVVVYLYVGSLLIKQYRNQDGVHVLRSLVKLSRYLSRVPTKRNPLEFPVWAPFGESCQFSEHLLRVSLIPNKSSPDRKLSHISWRQWESRQLPGSPTGPPMERVVRFHSLFYITFRVPVN
jgi:hypothetical protein